MKLSITEMHFAGMCCKNNGIL